VKGSDVVIEHVRKSFGDFKALDDVSIEIRKGEFFSLLGPSGCGKTTLLRIIAGFESPESGAVLLDGRDVLPLPPDGRHVNTVFQNYALFPHLSVFENVAFSMRLKKAPESAIKAKVDEYLNLVELQAHSHKKPSQLSGGQKQRVAIARALINEPDLILADEPTGNLDSHTGEGIIDLLCEIQRERQTTLIIATHDAQVAARAPRVIQLVDGQIQP